MGEVGAALDIRCLAAACLSGRIVCACAWNFRPATDLCLTINRHCALSLGGAQTERNAGVGRRNKTVKGWLVTNFAPALSLLLQGLDRSNGRRRCKVCSADKQVFKFFFYKKNQYLFFSLSMSGTIQVFKLIDTDQLCLYIYI